MDPVGEVGRIVGVCGLAVLQCVGGEGEGLVEAVGEVLIGRAGNWTITVEVLRDVESTLRRRGRGLGNAGVFAGGHPCGEAGQFGWVFIALAAVDVIQCNGLLLLIGGEAVAVQPVIGDDEVLHAIAGLRDADLAFGVGRVWAVGHGVLDEDGFWKEGAAAIAGNGECEKSKRGGEGEARGFHRVSVRVAKVWASEVSGVVEMAANSAGCQGRGAKR